MSAQLNDILAATRERVSATRAQLGELEAAARSAQVGPSWRQSLEGADVCIIGEIKRRSPSAGEIASDLSPLGHAKAYLAGGARAVSVLTDPDFFGGSLSDLSSVRAEVEVPLLRKDFIIDRSQIFESKAAGASAVLLIVRALDRDTLWELSELASELALERLVEVHDMVELGLALALQPETVGVNSRDLDTFRMDASLFESLLPEIPNEVLAVAESGIRDRSDVERVARLGADAVLVGTALARSSNPERAVRDMTGVSRRRRHVSRVRG